MSKPICILKQTIKNRLNMVIGNPLTQKPRQYTCFNHHLNHLKSIRVNLQQQHPLFPDRSNSPTPI